MPLPRHRAAQRLGLLRRQTELLEAIAEAVDADVAPKEQCPRCGDWFERVASHKPSCEA